MRDDDKYSMADNDIGKLGGRAIADALVKNTSLTSLSIAANIGGKAWSSKRFFASKLDLLNPFRWILAYFGPLFYTTLN